MQREIEAAERGMAATAKLGPEDIRLIGEQYNYRWLASLAPLCTACNCLHPSDNAA